MQINALKYEEERLRKGIHIKPYIGIKEKIEASSQEKLSFDHLHSRTPAKSFISHS
jgi:hypothetical protein